MNIREKLIDYIIEYGGDEYESSLDYIRLAKKSIKQLKQTKQDIVDYFEKIEKENEEENKAYWLKKYK